MLLAVVELKLGKKDRGYKEIAWLIDTANKKLSDYRNSGIHTPLMVFTDLAGDGETRILPNDMFGHRRARSLAGKNLLDEFERYHQQIRKMTTFAMGLSFKLKKPTSDQPWPQRPSL